MNPTSKSLSILSLAVAMALSSPVTSAGEAPGYERVNTKNLDTDERYDRLIVKYKEGTPGRSDKMVRAGSMSLAAKQALPDGKGGATVGIAEGQRLAVGADVIRLSRRLDSVEAATLMRQIAADPAVEYVEPPIRMRATAVPTDPRYQGEQWALKPPSEDAGGMNLPAALDRSTGEGVVVAVLDTGVVRHPDLAANVLYDEGYDFITDKVNSGRPSDGRVRGGYDTGDWVEAGECPGLDPSKSSWHGTHVAGTIAAVTNNNLGIAGVAPNAAILPVRVLGHCGGDSDDISDAIVWAAGGKTVPGVPAHQQNVEVINMSLGASGPTVCPNVYKDALAHAKARGVTVVVAAGNDSEDVTKWGGVGTTMGNCSDDIIVVGGVKSGGGRYDEGFSGSSHGHRVDVAAPAVAVLSTIDSGRREPVGPDYAKYTGTSMAAPHVAGLVALMQAAAETPLTPDQVKQMIMATARPFSIQQAKLNGRGIVDAEQAVLAASEGPCDASDATCTLAIRLNNRQPYELRAGDKDSETLYRIDVPAGARNLTILTSSGVGDVNVLVSRARAPTLDSSDFKSVRSGNNEAVRVPMPQAGIYYIRLVGNRAYSGVRLEVRYDN